MIVYLARHGETVANREKVVLGCGDSPLTPSGIETVEGLAAQLCGRQIRCLFSSPLGRALASARLMAERLEAAVIPSDALAELSCGQWEGKRRQQVLPGGGDLRTTWNEAPPGGESCREAETRVAAFIHWLQARPDLSPLLVVGHSVVNRVFLRVWLNLDPHVALAIHQPSDLIYILGQSVPLCWFNAAGDSGVEVFTDGGSRRFTGDRKPLTEQVVRAGTNITWTTSHRE